MVVLVLSSYSLVRLVSSLLSAGATLRRHGVGAVRPALRPAVLVGAL
jgi:hypothetical protein